jgi:hypothetical protein
MLAIALFASLLSPHGQAAALAGEWTVSTEGARGTTDDGSNWTLGAVTGSLTLAQEGADITGSWKGRMPESWALTGQLDDRTFVLQTEWRDIAATRDGVESTARGRWIFRGTLRDKGAAGTMTLELENAGGNRSQRFTATRVQPNP